MSSRPTVLPPVVFPEGCRGLGDTWLWGKKKRREEKQRTFMKWYRFQHDLATLQSSGTAGGHAFDPDNGRFDEGELHLTGGRSSGRV